MVCCILQKNIKHQLPNIQLTHQVYLIGDATQLKK
jgi:hypothetical protein